MLAENLENWAQKERSEGHVEGRMEGRIEGRMEGVEESKRNTARHLLELGVLSDEQIAGATELTMADIARLRMEDKH